MCESPSVVNVFGRGAGEEVSSSSGHPLLKVWEAWTESSGCSQMPSACRGGNMES